MKPKNVKERRNSFLKFLLLFVVTVGTIIIAVYFNFKIPTKENDLLKEQAKSVQNEIEFQNKFSNEMLEVKKLFDSLDVPSSNKKFINNLINSKIVELQAKIPTKDSTYRYDMYINIVRLNLDLLNAKDRLYELKDAESTIEEYSETLEKCKEDYKEIQREIDMYRRRN